MEKKVKIELSPYDLLSIYGFLLEYFNEETKHIEQFSSIQRATDNLRDEIYKNCTSSQIDEALVELSVHRLTNKAPLT